MTTVYRSANRKTPFPDSLILEALEPYRVQTTPELISAIRAYAETLGLWNQQLGLTSVRQPREIIQIHFGESLFATNLVDLSEGRLADVGSGSGFPGLALKLWRPALAVSLIEPNSKKAAFLSEVLRQLGIDGVEIYRGRMEGYAVAQRSFDFVTARAIGKFRELLEWSSCSLSMHGKVILWVGSEGVKAVKSATGWKWSEPTLLPNSRARFIVTGQRVTG